MAGKRHFSTVDHMTHNKLSRLEFAPQRSTACFGITNPQDLQTCQNFMAYPVPDIKAHGSSNPWSSKVAYLQYAGSALNDHLKTREASLKYQRSNAERQHKPLQLSDNTNNQVPLQSPVHSYHMSYPRACPPIAMPRPVYRSQNKFMDAAYGSRGFQSLGVCVASQPLCPSTVEWNSAKFTHSSPPSPSGTKKHLSTASTYPEVAGSPSSRSQVLQEQSPVYRHRADMSLAVGVSSTCSQKDIFTDACQTVAQQNIQLLYAEGNVPFGRQRTSAFTTPSPQHNRPRAYQGSLDCRMGNLYSKNPYSNTMNNIHQRSSQFSCNMDFTEVPHNVRGSSVYPNRPQHMHSGYVNAELRVQMSHLDGTAQHSERSFQVNPSTHKTIERIPESSPQRNENLWAQSGPINRELCETSSSADKEMLFDSTSTNRSLQERTVYQDPFVRQSVHTSFVQESSSSVKMPIVSSHELLSGQHSSSHSVTLEASSLHSSLHSFEGGATGIRIVENATISNSSRSHLHLEHAESTVPSSSVVSGVGSQYQINYNNVRSGHDIAALVSPNCELPGSNVVNADDPKSASTSVNEDLNIDNPKSPPMPVINDVFSLAPYRAYLEGKAPHPFSLNQESEVEDIASTSAFLEAPFSEDKTKKAEDISSTTKVVNADNAKVVKILNGECVQTGEQEVFMQNIGGESVVLDLSLKKLPQTSSSLCAQLDFPWYDKESLPAVAANKLPSKAQKQIQVQEGYMASDTSRIFHLDQVRDSFQASKIIVESSQDRLPSLGQEKKLSTENILPQTPKAFPWQHQENCQSQATETQKNKLGESSVSLASNRMSNQLECNYSRDTERSLSQHQKSSLPQMIDRLPQQSQKNLPSQDYTSKLHNFQDSYKFHSNKSLSCHPQDSSSQVPKSLPQQEPSSNTHQTLRTVPVHTSVQHPSLSDVSVFVNTMKSQTTILPVILGSHPAVYFTNTIALHTSQPTSVERPIQIARSSFESCHSLSSPSSSENESNGFQSSKSFMFRKYKMKKFSSEEQTHRVNIDSAAQNMSNLFSPDTMQSLPPSAPESSPALGEANVSLASVGEPSLSSSEKQFRELHHSVHTAITSAVARAPSSLLEDWLSKTKVEETSKTLVKTKNSFRSNDHSSDLPGEDIWLAFDGVRLLLHKLLSQLETFMFTRRCPFSHVIRAGAIFIPIYMVKEVLFPELLGPAVDKILQKHKVELRPTTLSEEKLLRETELKECPSRMLKLLALKQLPDVYPDLLCLFCRHTIQQELGSRTQSGLHTLNVIGGISGLEQSIADRMQRRQVKVHEL
ncbi:uncharacterized protein C15orf39 homolog isoform X2 [Hyla sarda]|uniref:uncharacterized protein C15orf39 homolog isoform X2 n=1 Tax=Hyla sarda TaxID=327740 RepID=UPI0024C42E99|nr:uncharacterized protein C15orf39 homolog isoform X2 [Hyla sarda]